MKKTLVSLMLATGLISVGYSQSNDVSSSLLDHFSPLLNATNWTVAPYATYAPNAPTKFGGGVLVIYNVSDYVGAGLGVDWLGNLSMTSGNLSLRYPIHVGGVTATPFVLAALATPVGGAGTDNGGVATIQVAGFAIATPFKVAGGNVGFGYAYANWTGAGDYSGGHHEAFLTWKKSF